MAGRTKHTGTPYVITLPDSFWEFIDKHKKTDYLIRSRSDSLLSLLRNAYPELKTDIGSD